MSEPEDRCTGHCCRAFTLPWSPAELQVLLADYRRWRRLGLPPKGGRKLLRDVQKITDMIIHLGRFPAAEWPAPYRPEVRAGVPPDEGHRDFYTCRHLLPDGNCGDYERRPQVCRDFPYRHPCQYAPCTWRKGREGRHPDRHPDPDDQGTPSPD